MTDRSRCFHHILVNILPNHTLTFAIPKEYSPSLSYVGGGSYGNVVRTEVQCKGANGSVCHSVAIKRFKNPFSDDRQARRLYREIKLLQLIRHDNLIRAFDLYSPDPRAEDLKEIYVVSIYAGTCLAQVLKNERKAGKRLLDMRQINAIIYQLLIAVKYLHSVKIIHRDLKPENLALRGDCTLTVLDFGLARSLDGHESQMTECVTTKRYRSPETIYWKVGNYSTPADLWSIGCIAGEIMQLSPIFTGDNETLLYTSIIEIVGSPSEQLLDKIERENDQELRKLLESFAHYHRRDFQKTYQQYGKEFADFLDKMLVLDPDERLTVEGALEHSYFEGWHVPEEEPLADWQFIEDKSLNEWKRIIWDEILNFSVEPFEEM